ncbi:DUF998 domain-containing protein [Mycolicibacterium cosmeticum]|uniref:DUF998 domain-containing protein n=1 Tax=Mycolicibacterium cosmeticum TaxID=258533 RepID=UPI0032046546
MNRRLHVLFGWIAVAGAAVSLLTVLTLDAVLGGQPLRGRTLRRATISEYVFTTGGWLFVTAVLALAAGSALLLVGLIHAGLLTPRSPGSVLLALWVIGLLGVVAFPKHNWAVGPSASGTVHRVATQLAFVALPVAVLVIARGREVWARTARWLAWGSIGWLGVLFGAIAVAAVTERSWWRIIPLGLVERGIAGFEVAAVLALAVWLIRSAPQAAIRS